MMMRALTGMSATAKLISAAWNTVQRPTARTE